MRMDNETFRLKAENLLGAVKTGDDGGYDEDVMAELGKMAATPRKVRYFLKAVSTHPDDSLQVYFYRRVMSRVRSEHDTSDLERHIRHMYYENREHAKEILAQLTQRDVIGAFLRVISFTEEGWLAGELIRIVLQAPPEELYDPIAEALESHDYLLQCLAIYLVGKSGDPKLLDALAQFYRRPVGEKVDRLERKALDALLEGTKNVQESQIVRWLKDRSARVREVALQIAEAQCMIGAVGDITGLVLIDPRTRGKAAQVLLHFEREGALRLAPGDATAKPVEAMLRAAKQEALHASLSSLIRDESPSVREVALRLVPFLRDPIKVTAQVRRVAMEDRVPAVQIAAIRVLAEVDTEKLVTVLVEVFTDAATASGGTREVIDVASELMSDALRPDQVKEVQYGIKAKEERRDAALDRFSGNVEWWRHDL